MPLSGQTVAQQLKQAFQDAQDELRNARAAAASMEHHADEIQSDRDRTLADLARHYLPSLTQESLLQTWSEVRGSIEQVLLKKESHIKQLEADLNQLGADKRAAEVELDEKNSQLDSALNAQQLVSENLSDNLSKDDQFIGLTQRAAEAEAALERAEASLEQIEHEASQKLPAYEASKLFMYLYRRGLATPEYTGRGFTRRMDRWIGRLIDFPKAKIGYEYLTSTPAKVRALVSQDRAALADVMSELEQRRDEEAVKLGLPKLMADVEEKEAEREAVLTTLEKIGQRIDETNSQLTEIQKVDGPYYQQAIDFFKTVLENSDQASLESRARRTPDPQDDLIVSNLKGLDVQARESQREATALQQRVEWLDRHLTELGSLQQRFRSSRYDSSRSEFAGSIDLQHDLHLVREGRDTIEGVWSRLRRAHQFAASPLENMGSGLAGAARHPLTQVLVHAMANAATNSMSNHARRAGNRHVSSRQTSSRTSANRSVGGGSQSYGSVRHHQPKTKPDRDGGFFTVEKF